MTLKIWNAGEPVLHGDLNNNFAYQTPYTVKIGSLGWLETLIPGTESAMAGGGYLGLSPAGASAAIFGARSSDSLNTGGQSFALGSFSINNNHTQVQTNYCAYFEARRTAGTGISQGLEINTVNQGEVHDAHPYFMGSTGSSLNLWLSSGRPDVSPNYDNTLAIGIISNGALGSSYFRNGIVFGRGSVYDRPVTGPVAVAMPASYALVWHVPNIAGETETPHPSALITSQISDVSTFSTPVKLIFNQTGVDVLTADNAHSLSVKSGLVTTVSQLINGSVSVGGALTHTGSTAGFYNTTPIGKPNVTGSIASGAALQSLLQALASLGLITNSTSA